MSRPRASCDAGLLNAAILSHPSRNPFELLEGAHDPLPTLRCSEDRSTDPCSPLGAHGRARSPAPPLRAAPTSEARDCASSLKDGHASSCTCFNVHGRARLLDARARVRLSTSAFAPASRILPSSAPRFRTKRPSALFPSAFPTKSSLAERTFRCLPCSPLDDHGQHSIGSQSTGSRVRVTFRREPASILFLLKIALASRTRLLRPPSPFDDGVCPAVGPASLRPPFFRSAFVSSRPPRDDPSPGHRRACVHLSFRTDFRSHRSTHDRSTPCDASRPLPLLRSDRLASLDAHDPPAHPCSRSRTCS